MTFTLFVILPNEDVCSLRHLPSGTSIRAVRKRLELEAGLPAQTYRLTCPQGQLLHEDHELTLDVNVWDGYVVRAELLDSWQELYDLIVANRVQDVIQHGAVHMRSEVVWMDGEEEGRAKEVMRERGVVALFVASFLGMQEMCKALLSVDVDPNGKTPFARTPLFAAMSRDHHHVMEILLAHNAKLESRDVDGVTAVDVGRRLAAKQCMRKVRHLQLQSQGENSKGVSTSRDQVSRRGPRIIRMPSGAVVPRESSYSSSTSSIRPSVRRGDRGESPDTATALTSTTDRQQDQGEDRTFTHAQGVAKSPQGVVKPSQGVSKSWGHAQRVSKSPGPAQPRPLFRQSQEGEACVYTWDNNLSHASRAPSAAGTQPRAVPPSSGRTTNRLNTAQGVSWGEAGSRMLPFRPVVHEAAIKGPSSVLTTSSSTTTALISSHRGVSGREEKRKGSALVRFSLQAARDAAGGNQHVQSPHGPAQEPPGRPPTRLEGRGGVEEVGSVGSASVLGSQEALSVGSAPELANRGGGGPSLGAELVDVDQGESDDDGGRVLSSRGKGSRSSGKARTRLLVSRQKQQESWRTMKRRLQLVEEQKRHSIATKTQPNSHTTANNNNHHLKRENFQQWLDRKRREQYRSSDEDTSDDDDDLMNRSAENSQAFNDWLRDLKRRPQRPQTSTPTSLHRRKGRPVKNVIQFVKSQEEKPVPPADPDTYMAAYREWQHRKTGGNTWPHGSTQDLREARKEVEEKRQSLLAMALTYQDWMDHTEQRKKLMQAILRADQDKLMAIEQQLFRTRRAPRQIPYNEWREKIDQRETEIRHQRHRMRKEAEPLHRNVGEEEGTTHDQWLQQKKENAAKNSQKGSRVTHESEDGVVVSEDEKQAAWEAWLEEKHKREVAELDKHLRQERQLLLSLRQKKPPTVSQC